MTVLIINMALMSIYYGTVTGFNTVLAICTEAFCEWHPWRVGFHWLTIPDAIDLSYVMPLVVRIWGWLRGDEEIDSAYPLRRLGMTFNIVSVSVPSVRALKKDCPCKQYDS